MNHLSLFSGIGGIDFAAHWAGFETVAFCEQNKFCQQVLNKHWPEVPIFDDIFTLTAESLESRGIEPGSIKLISGGFPCQPYSHAGKRLGNEDDRALWPEMLRVIREVKPIYVLGENVPGLVSLALDGVLSDLEKEGYETGVYILPACSVNAPHRRDRVFIIAHSTQYAWNSRRAEPTGQFGQTGVADGGETIAYTPSRENNGRERGNLANQTSGAKGINAATNFSCENVAHASCGNGYGVREPGPARGVKSSNSGQVLADTIIGANQRSISQSNKRSISGGLAGSGYFNPWSIEPDVGRVASGVPGRMDRLRALGNAVVPQQCFPILKAIANYELQESTRKE